MAKHKAKDLVTKTKDELLDQLNLLRKEQFNLRFQVSNGQNENPSRFRLIRREIASIKTIPNVSKFEGKTNASEALKCASSFLFGNLKFSSK